MKKILVVRFSSIGDIVLTTPVLRCMKQQLPNVEIHYLTKASFADLVSVNPHVDRVITIQKSINEVLPVLRSEKYDFLVDLHNNVRTLALKQKLGVSNASFPKYNVSKWILVRFKWNRLPEHHVVERYFEAVKPLGIVNDHKPCDFFLLPQDRISTDDRFFLAEKTYVAVAIGAQYATKRLPTHKLVDLINQLEGPVILLGGPTDVSVAAEIQKQTTHPHVIDLCGKLSLRESASVVQQAAVLVTHDTGLMHIASAFQTPTVSIWGNTVPALGMYPYFPEHEQGFTIHEVMQLSCRPCSKIGHHSCPKKHFNCMEQQDTKAIAADANRRKSARAQPPIA